MMKLHQENSGTETNKDGHKTDTYNTGLYKQYLLIIIMSINITVQLGV